MSEGLGKCAHCRILLPTAILVAHQSQCSLSSYPPPQPPDFSVLDKSTALRQVFSSVLARNPHPSHSSNPSPPPIKPEHLVCYKCPRCSISLDSRIAERHLAQCIREHYEQCGWREDNCTAVPAEPQKKKCVVVSETRQHEVAAPRSRPEVPEELAKLFRPCPLCQKLVSFDLYLQHLDACQENKVSCAYCGDGVAVSNYDQHCEECPRHRQTCYICGASCQVLRLARHLASCSQDRKSLTMFHGTSESSARAILRMRELLPSDTGLLGRGIYCSRNVEKAQHYGPVVLELVVHVGKVAVITKAHHPLQKCWQAQGFDSAWIPAGCKVSKSNLEEHCVADPKRVLVVGVVSRRDG